MMREITIKLIKVANLSSIASISRVRNTATIKVRSDLTYELERFAINHEIMHLHCGHLESSKIRQLKQKYNSVKSIDNLIRIAGDLEVNSKLMCREDLNRFSDIYPDHIYTPDKYNLPYRLNLEDYLKSLVSLVV